MSRLGGAAAVAPLVADMSSEGGSGGGESVHGKEKSSNGTKTAAAVSTSNDDGMTVMEQHVAKMMEEDMGSAMQYLQGKGLCLMHIFLATAISTNTCHPNLRQNLNGNGTNNPHMGSGVKGVGDVGGGPSSPNLFVLTG